MNLKEKRIMWTSILAPILIVMGVTLLVLGSIPIKNSIEDNTLRHYDRYELAGFSEEAKRQWRDTHWEEDLQKAFEAGCQMAAE